jgi:hypothetical protein
VHDLSETPNVTTKGAAFWPFPVLREKVALFQCIILAHAESETPVLFA